MGDICTTSGYKAAMSLFKVLCSIRRNHTDKDGVPEMGVSATMMWNTIFVGEFPAGEAAKIFEDTAAAIADPKMPYIIVEKEFFYTPDQIQVTFLVAPVPRELTKTRRTLYGATGA